MPSSMPRSRGDSASYAAYMLAQHVSPPIAGSCTARSIEPSAGCSMNDESVCQLLAPSVLGCGLVEHDHLGVLGVRLRERVVLERPEPAHEVDLLPAA